jgi:hypothetical protein
MKKIENWFRKRVENLDAAKLKMLIQLVERHFDFLFQKGFVVADAEYLRNQMGNWSIYLESDKFGLRITQDRDDVAVYLGPTGEPHTHLSLELILIFLTGNDDFDPYKNKHLRLEKSLVKYSQLTSQYFEELVRFFADAGYEKRVEGIRQIGKWLYERWEKATKQKYRVS